MPNRGREMKVIAERTRNDVWQGLWDAHRMVRYYQAVHKRNQRSNRTTMWALVVFGTSALATILEEVPDVFQPVAGLLLAAGSLWVLFADYAGKAAVALSIAHQCEELKIEWATLFARLDDSNNAMDEPQARRCLDDLKRRMKDATYRSGDAKLSDNDRINIKATIEATDELSGSYA